jgi:hypothetical protein
VAAGCELLGNRQRRRHDDGARVHRTAFERIVEILAVGGGAVDECRGRSLERARVTDRRGSARRQTAGNNRI